LRLREWGRRGLVLLTSLFVVCVVGFFAVFMWTALPALADGHVVFHVAGVIGLGLFGWPTWIMLRHLRGDAIRGAMLHGS
jgi:hypothetical protein